MYIVSKATTIHAQTKWQSTVRYYSIAFRVAYVFSTRLPLSSDDIDFIVQEIWQSKSAISGSKLDGGHERLLCYPWRTELPITPGNIVLITKNENDNLVANGIESLDAQIVNRIDRRLAEFGTWHE